MAKKNLVKNRKVISAMCIGISAMMAMTPITVHAEEPENNENEGEGAEQVSGSAEESGVTSTVENGASTFEYKSEEEYNAAVEEVRAVPENAIKSEDKDIWSWTDENGTEYIKEVVREDKDDEDSSEEVVITNGSTTTTEITPPQLVEVREDGTQVYLTGMEETTTDKIQIITNDNRSSETTVIETIIETIETTQLATNEDGSTIVDKVYSDQNGEYEIENIRGDENDKPIKPTIMYDQDGNEINETTHLISYEKLYDENGNRLYVDQEGNLTTEASTQSEEQGYTSIYEDDEDLAKIKELLGDYGITAQSIHINEAQTNINVGNVVASGNQTGVHGGVIADDGAEGDNQGTTMRIEDMDEGVKLGLKGNVSEVILGSSELADQIEFKENTVSAKIIIDSVDSVAETRQLVVELAEKIMENDSSKNSEGEDVSLEEWKNDSQKFQLDFTDVENKSDKEYDVVYATVSLGELVDVEIPATAEIKGSLTKASWEVNNEFLDETGINPYNLTTVEEKQEYVYFVNTKGYGNLSLEIEDAKTVKRTSIEGAEQNGSLYIYTNYDQIVVINVDTSELENPENVEINLEKYTVIVKDENDNETSYCGAEADGHLISQQLVLNFGDFSGTLRTTGSIFGTIIAPNANFINGATSSGQLVCNSYDDQSGEWHYTGTSVQPKKVISESDYVPLWKILAERLESIKTTQTTSKKSVLRWSSLDQIEESGGTSTIKYITREVEPDTPDTPPTTPDTPPTTPDTPPTTPDTPPTTPDTPDDGGEVLGARRTPTVVADEGGSIDTAVLGATRTTDPAVLGARRTKAVLGARRTPNTGDVANMASMMGLMFGSSALAGTWFSIRKRKNQDEEQE